MSAAGHGPWTAEQRDWLQALGHVPYRVVAAAEDPLRAALLRAAGADPADPRAAALLAGLPPAASLRGDPAAKRRLWPRLRALRARAG